MLRSIGAKVVWVGRATVFLVGLTVILAVVLGFASTAFGANGGHFVLGKSNVATLITRLAGPNGVNGAMFEVQNKDAGDNDTALSLKVKANEPPMRVDSEREVANLNADELDGQDVSTLMTARIYTVDEPVEMSSNETGTIRVVFCDDGDAPISGGFSGLGSQTHIKQSSRVVYLERPTWRVAASKAVGPEDTWTAQAVCADFGEPHQQQ